MKSGMHKLGLEVVLNNKENKDSYIKNRNSNNN